MVAPGLVVVDKPAGLVVHRGWADDEVALLGLVRDAVGAYVYPVHRLDRGASGVLVFALSSAMARALQEQWTAGAVHKRYLAIVRGAPPDAIEIDNPVPRSEDGPRVPAVTAVRTSPSISLISCSVRACCSVAAVNEEVACARGSASRPGLWRDSTWAGSGRSPRGAPGSCATTCG